MKKIAKFIKDIIWFITEFIIVFLVLAPAALSVYVLISFLFALNSTFKLIKTVYENRLRNSKASD